LSLLSTDDLLDCGFDLIPNRLLLLDLSSMAQLREIQVLDYLQRVQFDDVVDLLVDQLEVAGEIGGGIGQFIGSVPMRRSGPP
jgi:hypothetical protein